jgi:hypothetical protein
MRMKRVVVLIAVMSLLMIGTVSPTPARADGTEIAIIAVAAAVGYVAIVLIGTALVNRTPSASTEAREDPPVDGRQPPVAMRSGLNCRQSSADLTLVCW